jgi:hypothetical protein
MTSPDDCIRNPKSSYYDAGAPASSRSVAASATSAASAATSALTSLFGNKDKPKQATTGSGDPAKKTNTTVAPLGAGNADLVGTHKPVDNNKVGNEPAKSEEEKKTNVPPLGAGGVNPPGPPKTEEEKKTSVTGNELAKPKPDEEKKTSVTGNEPAKPKPEEKKTSVTGNEPAKPKPEEKKTNVPPLGAGGGNPPGPPMPEDKKKEATTNTSGVGWPVILAIVFALLAITFLVIFLLLKKKNGAGGGAGGAGGCLTNSDCGVGQICANRVCTVPDSGFCMADNNCLPGSQCINGTCVFQDAAPPSGGQGPAGPPVVVPGRPGTAGVPGTSTGSSCAKRVRFEEECVQPCKPARRRRHEFDVTVAVGDIRREYAKVNKPPAPPRVPLSPATPESPMTPESPEVPTPEDEAFDANTPETSEEPIVPVDGELVPYMIDDSGTYTPMVVDNAGQDVLDMCPGEGRSFIFLCPGGRLLVTDGHGQQRSVPTDRDVDRIMIFNNQILGVDDGTLVILTNAQLKPLRLPATGAWEEVPGIPTRIISHFSISENGDILHIRDVEHAYELNRALQVVRDMVVTKNRYLGRSADEYIDVDDASGRAVTSTGAEQNDVYQAVMVRGRAVPLTRRLQERGVRRLYQRDGKLYSLARGI